MGAHEVACRSYGVHELAGGYNGVGGYACYCQFCFGYKRACFQAL